MKKKINKKVPAYAFGGGQNGGMYKDIGTSAALTGDLLQAVDTNPESDLNVFAQSLSSSGNLASATGSFGGPIGMAAGAVVGGVTGLISGLKKREQIREQKRRRDTAIATKNSLNYAANTALDYYSDNGEAYTFENGGMLPNLAYLDNNEIVRYLNGNITKVPNTKPGTDNHLVDSTTLDSVLSNKIKRPGTNRTFAQEGEKLVNMSKESKGKDIFAQNSNKLNKINANRAYEALLAEQEAVKAKKGVKPKKKSIPAYEDGKDKYVINDPLLSMWNTTYDLGFGRTSTTPQYNFLNSSTPAGRLPWLPMPTKGNNNINYTTSNITKKSTPSVKSTASNTTQTPSVNTQTTKTIEKNVDLPEAPLLQLDEYDLSDPVLQPSNMPKNSGNRYKFNLSGNLLELAPVLYNLLQGLKKPEYESTELNPYSSSIIKSMAKRRANVQPAIEANRRSRAIANYNAANVNANTGMNLALRSQLAANEYAKNADIYANRDNTNNAYLGEYANTLNNLGQQYVQSSTLANDLNARNRAKARDYASSAASQIGQWAQVKEQMKNQYNRDLMMLPFLSNFLSQGFTQEQVDELVNRTKKRA